MPEQDVAEILRRVQRIQIVANRTVNDLFAGHYKSVFRGRGMMFDEVREYQPGDDIAWTLFPERAYALPAGAEPRPLEPAQVPAAPWLGTRVIDHVEIDVGIRVPGHRHLHIAGADHDGVVGRAVDSAAIAHRLRPGRRVGISSPGTPNVTSARCGGRGSPGGASAA